MGQITTYVCDVSGKTSNEIKDFVTVNILSNGNFENDSRYGTRYFDVKKLIHRDIAITLGVKPPDNKDVKIPELSFEDKLKALLTNVYSDYLADLVSEQVSTELSNRS